MTEQVKALKRTASKPLTTTMISALKEGQILSDGNIATGAGRLKIRKRSTQTGVVAEWLFIYWGADKKRITILLNGKASRYSPKEQEGFLTLVQARELARKLVSDVQTGIDPMAQRVLDKAATQKKQATAVTKLGESKKKSIQALMDAYVSSLVAKGKTKSARDVQNLVKNHLTLAHPSLATKAAAEVTPQDISTVLACMVGPAVEKKIGRTATKLRSFIGSAYKLGIGADLDPMAPAHASGFELTTNPALAVPVTQMAAKFHKIGERTLSKEELRCYLIRLEAVPNEIQRIALELQILAGGQRMEQLLRLTRTDLTEDTFTLYDPKGKRLQPRTHILPILPEIRERLERLEILSPITDTNTKGALFSSSGGSIVNATSLSKLAMTISKDMIAAKESTQRFRGGDIRRTCETLMAGELGISEDTRGQVLSHGLGGVQNVVYDKGTHLAEKKKALRAWVKYLRNIRSKQL